MPPYGAIDRRRAALACALVPVLDLAVAAGPAATPPRDDPAKAESRILYHEESGGLVTPIAPPVGPGSRPRGEPGAASAPDAKASGPRVAPAPAPRATAREPARTIAAPKTAPRQPPTAIAAPKPVPVEVLEAKRAPDCEAAWARVEPAIRDRTFEAARDIAESAPAACARMVHERLLARLATVATSGPAERAQLLAQAAGPSIVAQRDAPSAQSIGWLWLEGGDAASAGLWFERARVWAPDSVEAVRGRALAALAERDYATTLAVATTLPASVEERATLRREALLALAQRDYRAERFAEALAGLEAAQAEGSLPRSAKALQGWANLALGRRESAADIFTGLYREAPDLETAQGIVSAQAANTAIDPALAASEPLATLIHRRQATRAFEEKRFMEARALDAEKYAELGAGGVLHAVATAGWRDKSGDPGLSKLRVRGALSVEVSTPVAPAASLWARADRAELDAGTPNADALLGSAGPAPRTGLGATHGHFEEARIGLRVERGLAYSASLGRAPYGAVLPARTIGAFEVAGAGTLGQASIAAATGPVRESVLAYGGMRDPDTGRAWGRVVRTGFEARALWLERAPWSVGATLAAARLTGESVQDNNYASVFLSAGRDLGFAGFSYASLAANAGYERYARNLSHFTVGHGGYFSPQRYARLGMAFDFMTREDHDWMVRGRAAGGWVDKREAAAPFLPLAPDGRFYAASSGRGHEASLQLAGVMQLDPCVQVGLAFARSISPQYGERQVLLMVRYLFEPRRGVVSSDLPVLRL